MNRREALKAVAAALPVGTVTSGLVANETLPHEMLSGQELGRMLCEVMGLETKHVASIDIHCQADEAAKVVITKYVTDQQAAELSLKVAQFRATVQDELRLTKRWK